MGAFGIFLSILTFIYLVGYCIMIGMDLVGDKKQKKDSEEIIPASPGESGSDYIIDEKPKVVLEESEQQTDHSETQGDNSDSTSSNSGALAAEGIAKAKNEELVNKAKEEMSSSNATGTEEYNVSEMTQDILETLFVQNQTF